MNETVKAALLAERRDALYQLEDRERAVQRAKQRLDRAESAVPEARDRLADVETFLRDNGVDLVAVDADADGLRTLDAFDPTAGLAKALDEA